MLLCGKFSKELIESQKLDEPIEYYHKLTDFFIFSEGLTDFFSIIKQLLLEKEAPKENKIQHLSSIFQSKLFQAKK